MGSAFLEHRTKNDGTSPATVLKAAAQPCTSISLSFHWPTMTYVKFTLVSLGSHGM